MNKYSIETIDREYTPKDAARITGVSNALQRDWRRRGLLPETRGEGWARFTASDLIEMIVMKELSTAGHSVQSLDGLSKMAVLPTLEVLYSKATSVEFDGAELSEEKQEFHRNLIIRNPCGSYFIAAWRVGSETQIACFNDFEELHPLYSRDGAMAVTFIDCASIAFTLEKHDALPVSKVLVTEIEK